MAAARAAASCPLAALLFARTTSSTLGPRYGGVNKTPPRRNIPLVILRHARISMANVCAVTSRARPSWFPRCLHRHRVCRVMCRVGQLSVGVSHGRGLIPTKGQTGRGHEFVHAHGGSSHGSPASCVSAAAAATRLTGDPSVTMIPQATSSPASQLDGQRQRNGSSPVVPGGKAVALLQSLEGRRTQAGGRLEPQVASAAAHGWDAKVEPCQLTAARSLVR